MKVKLKDRPPNPHQAASLQLLSTLNIAPFDSSSTFTFQPQPSQAMSYFELHARSAFQFFRGASDPEDLAKTAFALGLSGAALLDRDGVYGRRGFMGGPRRIICARASAPKSRWKTAGRAAPRRHAPSLPESLPVITEAKLVEAQAAHHRLWVGALIPPRSPWGVRHPPTANRDLARSNRSKNVRAYATWSELERFSEGLIALTGR